MNKIFINNKNTLINNKFPLKLYSSPKSKSNYNNLSKKLYSTATDINIQNITNNEEDYSIKMILPNFIKPTIKISKNSTFKDLSTVIKKQFNFESIEFRTWDHSRISLANDLSSCMESGNLIFLRIDDFEWQLLNYDLISSEYPDVFSAENGINLEVKNLIDTSQIVKNFEYNLESRYLQLQKTLEEYNKNSNISLEELEQIAIDLYKIQISIHLKNEVSDFNLKENSKAHNLLEVMEEYYKCKSEYAKSIQVQNNLDLRAKALTKILIYLGGIFFILELIAIYYFTFEVYTWDITEPIVYMLGCINLIIICLFKRKFNKAEPFTYFRYLFLRFFIRRSKKIDLKKMEELKKRISDIEKLMSR